MNRLRRPDGREAGTPKLAPGTFWRVGPAEGRGPRVCAARRTASLPPAYLAFCNLSAISYDDGVIEDIMQQSALMGSQTDNIPRTTSRVDKI